VRRLRAGGARGNPEAAALAILRRRQIRANVYEGLRRGLVENPLTFYQLERLEFHIERLKGLLGGSE
jgi:hypothetical protein